MPESFFANLYRRLPVLRELIALRESLAEVRSQIAAARIAEIVRLDLELAQHSRYGDPLRLPRYALQINSQNGEDGIIHEIFRRIGTSNRIFAEVGVGDGAENNTAFLLSQGWSGFWIDAEDHFIQPLERQPTAQRNVRWLVSPVHRENIAELFQRLKVPREFDLLSLDIDQNTYYAWEGLRDYRPRAVVVEYNAALPADVDWKVAYDPQRRWDDTQNFGASLKAFELLGRQLGYSLVGCEFIGSNAFFVRNDLVGTHFAAPFTSENHHEPPRYPFSDRRIHVKTILDPKSS
jgi:hypothetical protein